MLNIRVLFIDHGPLPSQSQAEFCLTACQPLPRSAVDSHLYDICAEATQQVALLCCNNVIQPGIAWWLPLKFHLHSYLCMLMCVRSITLSAGPSVFLPALLSA